MTQKNITIGFFGDSFCSNVFNEHSIKNNYRTYIQKVADHFDATITNTGIGGSSVWDLILIQFKEQINKGLPDICVFVWTDMARLFDRKHRNINFRSSQRMPSVEHKAALDYFYHLYDDEKQRLECTSIFFYFDTVILPTFTKTKFIHLWSFGEESTHGCLSKERQYLYTWKTGFEIRPALETFSIIDGELPELDDRPNHIDGENKNQQVADLIIDAINCLQA